jgi:biopolymer transport protein ExbB/TolQ
MGLFGTVFGIIDSFVGMGKESSSGISAMTAGIAEALVTTVIGLAVAVAAVWLFNYFISDER